MIGWTVSNAKKNPFFIFRFSTVTLIPRWVSKNCPSHTIKHVSIYITAFTCRFFFVFFLGDVPEMYSATPERWVEFKYLLKVSVPPTAMTFSQHLKRVLKVHTTQVSLCGSRCYTLKRRRGGEGRGIIRAYSESKFWNKALINYGLFYGLRWRGFNKSKLT